MYKVAVAGTGYVGLVAGVCFAEKGQDVICVDIDEEKINKLKNGICPIYEENLEEMMNRNYKKGNLNYTTDYKEAYRDADFIFIGVGTPENIDGSAKLDYVYNVAKQIAETIEKDCIVVIKSTVPIGTNDKIEEYIRENLKNNVKVNVASNPEFLAQGKAVHDTLHASRIVIGTENDIVKERMLDLYKNFDVPKLVTKRKSAEMIKYASNDFLALKISYINDIANLCEHVGADIEEVTKGMSYDERIGNKFLSAGCGYGGSCFPKDTKALHYLAEQGGYELKTIKAAIEVNKMQKLILIKKARKVLKSFNNLKIAVLGLTFKPGTDDLREAPSLENIPIFLSEGANVTVFDPVGEQNVKKKFPKWNVQYAKSAKEALKNADACFIFTEWEDIKKLKRNDFIETMKEPLIFDGRNLYNLEDMRGTKYYSVGRQEVLED